MSESTVTFPHNQLDVYRVAQELAVACWRVAEQMPRGAGPVADQLRRAGISVPLNVGEGANRAGVGEKRQKFSIARGEAGEAAAALELAVALGLARSEEAEAARALAGRVAAMLTRLIQRHGG